MNNFYETFTRLCCNKGLSPTAAALAIGLDRSAVTRWKQGHYPAYHTQIRIADFFGIDPAVLQAPAQTAVNADIVTTFEERELLTAFRRSTEKERCIIESILGEYGYHHTAR